MEETQEGKEGGGVVRDGETWREGEIWRERVDRAMFCGERDVLYANNHVARLRSAGRTLLRPFALSAISSVSRTATRW